MTSSAALSAKLNLKQCHVINLNLTNATTLLSKRLQLSATQPAADSDSDAEDINVTTRAFQQRTKTALKFKSKSTGFEASSKQAEPTMVVATDMATDADNSNSKSLMNFQNTLRTYCLDGDFVSRQKKQRIKSFNAKIRRSIKTHIKKRQQADLQKLSATAALANQLERQQVSNEAVLEAADKPMNARAKTSSQSPKLCKSASYYVCIYGLFRRSIRFFFFN
jgi:hypothetical protein